MSILELIDSDETNNEIHQIDHHHRQIFLQIMKRLNYVIAIILIIVVVKEN